MKTNEEWAFPSTLPCIRRIHRRRRNRLLRGGNVGHNHESSRLRKVGGCHRGYGRRLGRADNSASPCRNRNACGKRRQAHPIVLPGLRQDGMRRMGYCRRWKSSASRRRQQRPAVAWQLLHEIPVFHAGGLSSRPFALSHEAYESQGRRPWLGAHLLG